MRRINQLFLVITFFILGCSIGDKEIAGIYAAIGYNNTKDTIVLCNDGIYERKVYDNNNRLVLKTEGKWSYKDGLITMRSFFLNLDRDVSEYPELLKDTTMRMQVLVEKEGGVIKFCTGYLNNENCYGKVIK